MTSEIALLNRTAVAIAADSAMTVTYWDRGEQHTRYFKRANKIFQLSSKHPVGAMIYADAELQGVPWEVLIKSFRDHLGQDPHDDLPSYATSFFSYLVGNNQAFPLSFQEEQFKASVDAVAGRFVVRISGLDDYKNAATDAEKLAASSKFLGVIKTVADHAPFIANAEQSDVDNALSKYESQIEAYIRNDSFFSMFAATFDLKELSRLAIVGLYKGPFTSLSASGVVIAGFGSTDFFPQLRAYRVYGLVLGKLLWEEEKDKGASISQQNGSAIIPFAQDQMIKTFMQGVGSAALAEMTNEWRKSADALFADLESKGLLSKPLADATAQPDFEAAKKAAHQVFVNGLSDYFISSHSTPLRRVVGMLSKDELGDLAETLISIESLKERVTQPSESVSGPVDVAIISRNDGFIWIKRKHYFDATLNPRYFARST